MHVNAFMAYKYEQPSNVTLLDFTEQVVGGLVAAAQLNLEEEGGGLGGWGVTLRRSQSKAAQDLATAMPLHCLLSNKIKGVGSLPNFAGRCRICTEYAYGHCSTCTDYGGARRKVRGSVWFLCVPGASGRHCYAAHMHEQLTGRMPDA